ncbi:MAG: Fe-S cluster assembly transcriptional regulator IscR [Betaproteobacteria bacterium]|jgi:Rrf2 family transcriptional regulator, iron-sulfur cluster assembly transcription factor
MRLTTKGRFAVTAMIDVALRQHNGPVTLAGISQRQKISLSYLEQLFGRLRRHELVESTRGPGGGYTLGKPMADISVADIIYAVDEPLDATQCGGKENCVNDQRCMTHDLWASLNRVMVDYLDSVTLRDLAEKQREKLLEKGVNVAVLHDNRQVAERRPARGGAAKSPAVAG